MSITVMISGKWFFRTCSKSPTSLSLSWASVVKKCVAEGYFFRIQFDFQGNRQNGFASEGCASSENHANQPGGRELPPDVAMKNTHVEGGILWAGLVFIDQKSSRPSSVTFFWIDLV